MPNSQLGLIDRVEIAATGGSERPWEGSEYHQAVLRSSVTFRNRSTTASRVVGVVLHDVDADGIRDPGELGLRDVIVRCSNNMKTKTNVEGLYSFVLNPGIYTITEVDPPAYASTTPNVVPVNPTPGDYTRVDFGDVATAGTGRILGTVFKTGHAAPRGTDRAAAYRRRPECPEEAELRPAALLRTGGIATGGTRGRHRYQQGARYPPGRRSRRTPRSGSATTPLGPMPNGSA